MEKRVFLAIFLSFAILAVYQAYFAPPPPKPGEAQTAQTSTSAAPNGSSTAPARPAAPPAAGAAPARQPQPAMPPALVSDSQARDITIETDTVTAVFSTKGAVLESWRLKRYFDADHHPLELIPQVLPDAMPKPFTIGTDDPNVSREVQAALYHPSVTALNLGGGTGAIEFEYRDASGLTVRKAFDFQPDGKAYVVGLHASIVAGGKELPVVVEWGPGVGLGYNPDGSRAFPARAIQMRDKKVERLSASNLAKQSRYEAAMRFAGVEDQYFLSVALAGVPPAQPQMVRLDYQPITLPVPNDPQNRTRSLVSYSVRTPGAAAVAYYVGPKDLDSLRSVDPELTEAIDFGMFRFLVVPLLQALKSINHYIGNYGWSIVVLTVFINLLIFPLRHRSMVSMRKMQAVQPEVKAIQERYAKYKITDPERQKMNQEMMALYKQKGVNPASGCVPMLLTMPVLYAFYALLGASIELRGAPFFGWMHDLSLKDPLYITPVLMGITMFWQQKMMPSTADPVQQKMFLVMPIVFTFMFLAAPSGLVVYWLVSNLLAIGQQYFTNRTIGAAPARVAPARVVKSVGSGRTKG